MNRLIVALIMMMSIGATASEWKQLVGYDLHELYSGGMANLTSVKREVTVVGTSGLSWPDGRQAIVTTLEVEQDGKRWLYRCTQYLSRDMVQTGEICYELRK